jgi:hypothetical protein
MGSFWDNVLRRLGGYPAGTHELLPPCSEERLRAVQSEYGRLPNEILEMLRHFNGARLFVDAIQLVAIFGVSTIPALPPFEWAEDWYIDKFTPWWRAGSEDRQKDWAIAMMNYGGVVIVGGDGRVREWDTAQRMWDPRSFDNFDEWVQEILREGDAYLKEE